MKKEVEYALLDMQIALWDNAGSPVVNVEADTVKTVLRWAEQHGLKSHYGEGDRVMLLRTTLDMEAPFLYAGAMGTIYQVFGQEGPNSDVRVLWDDDPLKERQPIYIRRKHLRKVWE